MTLPTSIAAPLFSHQQGGGDATVVCLHSSTGSNAQWRGMKSALADRCRLVVPDLHGHGQSPAWPAQQTASLQADAQAVEALLRQCAPDSLERGVHLVGHSYGGAVALQMAINRPQWVRSLTLYEPVAFGVIRAMAPHDEGLGEIEDIAHSVAALVKVKDLEGAARVFVRYWGGALAWDALDGSQRAAVVARIATVPRHFEALFDATWGIATLCKLAMPVLLIQGANTRAPAALVTDLLRTTLPHVGCVKIKGAAHLGPITHDADVTPLMLAHLGLNARLTQTGEAARASA
jgi:pimeloyl-ACP methyl ester carboxylesterase